MYLGSTTVQRPRKVMGMYQDEGSYTGPDKEAFLLGNDPNYAANFAAQAQGTAQTAAANQNFVRGDAGAQGARAMNAGGAALVRANPAAQQVGQSYATGQQQGGLADRLQSFAAAPEGPSAAQAQLQAGTNQALASQLALARSGGGGFGESAAMLSRAGQNAAGIQAAGATGAAQLRAQETAANRDRSLAAYGAAGNVLGQQRAGTMQEGGLNLDAAAQRDAAALGWSDRELAARQLESDAGARWGQSQLEAQALGLDAEKAALAGRGQYQGAVSDLYQAELQNSAEHRKQDRDRDKDWAGGAIGAISSLGMFSDVRAKTDIKDYSGIGKYEYAYKNPERHGRGRYVGPMAHELEHIPGVVSDTPEGKTVDPNRLTMANASEIGDLRREVELLKRGRR